MVENLLGYLIGDVTNDAAVYVASSLMVENCHVPVGCLVSSQVCCIYIGQWPPNTEPEFVKTCHVLLKYESCVLRYGVMEKKSG